MSATCGVELTARSVHRPGPAHPRRDRRRPPRRAASTTPAASSWRRSGRTATTASRATLPDDLGGAITVARGPRGAGARRGPGRAVDAPEDARARALRLQQSAGALIEDLGVVEQVSGQPGGVGRGQRQLPRAAGGPPRRGRAAARRAVDPPHRGAHERHAAGPPPQPARRAPGRGHRARCGQPVRLRGPGRPLLRGPPARPAQPAATSPRWPTRWPSSSRRPAGARSRCSRASACSTRSPPRLADRVDGADPHAAVRCRRAACSRQFAADPATCLFATMGFWQGVDVPGEAAQPGGHRPHPVPPARRAAPAGPAGAGRRRRVRPHRPPAGRHAPRPGRRPAHPRRDRPGRRRRARPPPGQAGYRWDIVRALPPMRRTKDPEEARAALRAIRTP